MRNPSLAIIDTLRLPMTKEITVHGSSGNVFADLGIEDSEEYMAKSELSAEVLRMVQRRRLTQAEADRLLRIRQPKVSELLRGHLDSGLL
jgi:predicted XRE-type DNA-binding protein